MRNRPEVVFDVGDEVWVVHPTEILYRWIIDGPLTVSKVYRPDERRILYTFVEFQSDTFHGYYADRVFSNLQDAVAFRAQMLRKYKYVKPKMADDLNYSEISNSSPPSLMYNHTTEAIETNEPTTFPCKFIPEVQKHIVTPSRVVNPIELDNNKF